MKPTIGALVPRSSTFPNLGIQFISGIRLGLSNTIGEYDLIVEDIGTGGSKDKILEKVQKLQLQHMTQAQIAFAGSQMIEYISEYAHPNTIPFLLTNLGATTFPFSPNPYFLYHSYGLSKSQEAFGRFAATKLGKTVAVISGFHESGYSLYHHFEKGLIEAGGQVGMIRILQEEVHTDLDVFLSQMQQHQVSCLLLNTHHQEALGLIKQFYQSKNSQGIHLLLNPFALQLKDLNHAEFSNLQAYTSTPWIEHYASEAESEFAKQFKKLSRQLPTPFALVGFEAGVAIGNLLMDESDSLETDRSFLDQETTLKPRQLFWDKTEGTTNTPAYVQQLNWSGEAFETQIVTEVDGTTAPSVPEGVPSGWVNPYLCT